MFSLARSRFLRHSLRACSALNRGYFYFSREPPGVVAAHGDVRCGYGWAFAATGLSSLVLSSSAHALAPLEKPLPDNTEKSCTSDDVLSTGFGRWTVADAVESAAPSVTEVVLTSAYSGSQRTSHSSGSGFIYDRVGDQYFVLTNAHVITNQRCCDECDKLEADGVVEQDLAVSLPNGQSYKATVVASDLRSDVAVLAFESEKELPVSRMGKSETLRSGEFVIALGSPRNLNNSCSFGIVSNIARGEMQSPDGGPLPASLIQVDAAVNQGSSGGPIVDLEGLVRGMVCMKLGSVSDDQNLLVEGISFAIPISYVLEVARELREFGKCRKPYVGLCTVTLNREICYDLANDPEFQKFLPSWLEDEIHPRGLLVHSVEDDSPASRASLKRGDVILSTGGNETKSVTDFLHSLSFSVEGSVVLKVRRASGELENLTIQPSEQM